MTRSKAQALAVLVFSAAALGAMVPPRSHAQELGGRREASGKIYAAPTSEECDPDEGSVLETPYQLWREAGDLRSQFELSDPRRIIFGTLNRDGVGFPSDGPRVDGLYFSELKQVLLVPTQGASGTSQRPDEDGIPCRYLVMGGPKSARGIFRSLDSTASSNRYVAVKAGSILDVWPAAPKVLSTAAGRPYISVDVENFCYQTDSDEDELPPRPGIFYLEMGQDLIAEPIAWCDPEELRKLAPPPDPTPSTEAGAVDNPPVEDGPPLPEGYLELGELDELADIFNAFGRGHGVPPVTALVYRCAEQQGLLDFWIGLREETSLPVSLPEPFGVLAAQMVDVNHRCRNVRKLAWRLGSAPEPIELEVVDPAKLGFEWVHSMLSSTAGAGSEDDLWDNSKVKPGSQRDVAALYHRLTAGRPDLPRLESWRDQDTDTGKGLRVYLKMRGPHRPALSRLLCAHLAAASPVCRKIDTVICYAGSWSRKASFTRSFGCNSSEILRRLR